MRRERLRHDRKVHPIEWLKNRSPEEQRRFIANLTPLDALLFDADFEAWAHDSQLPPLGEGWGVWRW